jgi:hypothetical protein
LASGNILRSLALISPVAAEALQVGATIGPGSSHSLHLKRLYRDAIARSLLYPWIAQVQAKGGALSASCTTKRMKSIVKQHS